MNRSAHWPADAHCLLHVSDLHFGTETPAVLHDLLDWVRTHRPSGWVLTGDITQRATVAQFAQARAFRDAMQGLGVPLLGSLPGNHDIPLFNLWQRFRTPYRRYARAFEVPETVPPVLRCEQPQLLLLLVKTTRRHRHERGELSESQIEAVAAHLRAARPEQLRVVAVHQPLALRPEAAGGGMVEADLLERAEQAIPAWAEAGCDLVLGGHAHLPYALRLPVPQAMWVLQAGTAISSRTRAGEPNSFATICWRDGAGHGAPPRQASWQPWRHRAGKGFEAEPQLALRLR